MAAARRRLIGLGLGTLLSIPACILLIAAEPETGPGHEAALRYAATQSLRAVEALLGVEMSQALLAAALPALVEEGQKPKPAKTMPLPPQLLTQRGWLGVMRSGVEAASWRQEQQPGLLPPYPDPDGAARAMRLGGMAISDLQPGQPGTEPFIMLHSPMPPGAGGGVLSLALPLSILEGGLRPSGIAMPYQTVLVDGRGQVLAPRAARLGEVARVGSMILAEVAPAPSGTVAAAADGGSQAGGWRVVSGPGVAAAESPARQLGRLLPGIALAATLLLFMLLVWQTRRRILPQPAPPGGAEREAERRLSDIAANLPGALFRIVRDPGGRLSSPYLSEGIDALLGEASGSNGQEALLRGLSPAVRQQAAQALAHSADTLTPFILEGDFTCGDGRRLRLRSMASVHAMDDGSIIWDGVLLDSTEQRAAEERATLLAREVDHRAKNIMSVVRSLLLLTPRDVPPAQFVANLDGRISAMARAHDLLAGQGWAGADLGSVVQRELGIYEIGATAPQLRWGGPDVRLASGSVQPVAMVLHELATNAAKHGALSLPGGQVELRWSGSAPGGLVLDWLESGGPAVAGEPGRLGFGFRLIHTVTRHQLGGGATFLWSRDGLRCRIRLGPGRVTAVEPELRLSDTPIAIPQPPQRQAVG